MRWCLVSLNITALFSGKILQLSACSIECISDCDIGIFVGMVLFRITVDNDFTIWHGEIDTDMEQIALMVMAMWLVKNYFPAINLMQYYPSLNKLTEWLLHKNHEPA